jgi:hypothetical protein
MGFTLGSYEALKRGEKPHIAAFAPPKHVIQTRPAIFQTVSRETVWKIAEELDEGEF